MSARGTRATELLRAAGVAFTVHEYDPEAAPGPVGAGRAGDAAGVGRAGGARGAGRGGRVSYGEATVAALGLDAARVFKTLIASVDGRLVCAVVPVAGELDLKRLADAVGGRKASMAEPAEAERATGYVVGGISPLGQRRRLPIVVDVSAGTFATIYVSGGRRAMQVEVAPADLVRITGATVTSVARLG